MRRRDKAILDDLKKFRVLDRDQIIKLHFGDQKQPITTCNRIMNRLVLKGYVKSNTNSRPYDYFHAETTMKKDSMKIPHFKMIVDFYICLYKYAIPNAFEVEFKTGKKGSIEPDIYMNWNGTPFFVEIQRSVYTKKVMDAKIKRYEEYYESRDWKSLNDVFPLVWIITDHTYQIETEQISVYQSKDVDDFINRYMR